MTVHPRRPFQEGIKLCATLAALMLCAVGARAQERSTYTFNSGYNCNGVWRMPDTGQTQCYDNQATPVAGACPGGGNGTGPGGQDGVYTPAATQPRYTVLNPVGISSVTVDNVTGLMWVTNPGTDAGMGGTYTWDNALLACENLNYAGYTDWRLPNVRELASIIDYGVAAPTINATAFPGTVSAYFASTTYVPSTVSAWIVTFNSASVGNMLKSSAIYVRCVRGGP